MGQTATDLILSGILLVIFFVVIWQVNLLHEQMIIGKLKLWFYVLVCSLIWYYFVGVMIVVHGIVVKAYEEYSLYRFIVLLIGVPGFYMIINLPGLFVGVLLAFFENWLLKLGGGSKNVQDD